MSNQPEYTYQPRGRQWVVIHWTAIGNSASGETVATFFRREEARKECYRLNGWKYKGPSQR